MGYDIKLFYSGNSYITCYASRWDDSNYSVTIETWLKKSDLNLLRTNIRPGAVGELYTILGKPKFYDKSWSTKNTITIYPNSGSYRDNSNLMNMRNKQTLYVKNISDNPIAGNSGWINVKIEGNVSSSRI